MYTNNISHIHKVGRYRVDPWLLFEGFYIYVRPLQPETRLNSLLYYRSCKNVINSATYFYTYYILCKTRSLLTSYYTLIFKALQKKDIKIIVDIITHDNVFGKYPNNLKTLKKDQVSISIRL